MTRFTTTTTALAALLATTTIASAGGVERSAQSMGILFEEGAYAELSFSYADPDVSGTGVGQDSGDIAESYVDFALRYRDDITDDLSYAIIFDRPIGADVAYGSGTYPLAGSEGNISSEALTVALRYELDQGFSIYGGLRAVSADGNVYLTAPAALEPYEMDANGSTELGYMLGAAYERPEIALRVALTYHSATNHTFEATESSPAIAGGAALGTSFETTIPQSLTLEAQSGIAEGTLLFGSVRWVDWSEFDITPTNYNAATTTAGNPSGSSLVDYENDVYTYSLGIGRQLTDELSGAISVTHETSNGGYSGNLGPTDGRTAIGLALSYNPGTFEITGGVQYSWLGDAETVLAADPTTGAVLASSSFEDNSAIGVGIRIGYSF
ncbi:OmpP1/FadL family transporter [Gymnodinialimonas ceratoperidinii]|uniref:Outer membrane protein transport protein n=1 Tax=Gymnodinialimonas ceratoperidinii TaxID=2856823 RepID=A0A8F6TSZ9_9RHOB|nr:outer membrane protein transport protein [Gymnodinialimonas ceratoperidinii]QXT38396.1 outer membrane protein transport protein [Gymnodinialimonas ceratoperidinii]